MLKQPYIWIMVVVSLLTSCQKDNEALPDNVVVKVYNKSLYNTDIQKLVPENIGGADSVDITQKYIQKWITRELIVQKAIFNVGANDPEINKLVEDYRNSLIVKKYKEMLLERKANIDPTPEEIEAFYQQYGSTYTLSEDVVQGVIMKIPADAPKQKDLITWLKSDSDDVYTDIEGYSYQHAIMFDDFRNKWVALSVIQQLMPQAFKDEAPKMLKKKYVEQTDTLNNYFFRITALKQKSEVAPKEYVEEKIITLLRHKKKLQYFSTFEKDIYNEGIKDESVIYNPKYE